MKTLCKRLISFMLAVCMMVSMVPLGFAAEEQETNSAVSPISGNVKRIAGDDRIATSLGIATQLKDTLNVEKFETVVVASALNFPDALTGSYLAAKESAPILLTYEAANAKVQTYIENNLKEGGTVYILGGSTAVSTGFEDDLSAKGINVVRLAGSDRFGTNLAILQKAGITSGQEVLICTATGFADSLSASAAGLPILLVHNSLRADQKDYLTSIFGAEGNYTIIGGEAAVSADIEQELAAMGTVKRLGGSSRYETSVLVAENFFGTTPGGAVLAYARNFPDGLCAGPLAYAMNAPLILTDNYDPREADEYVVGTNRGFVVGGPGLISDVATRAIFDLGSGTGVASYTVTFESNGGSAVQAQIVDSGGTVTKPADPTRRGRTFAGWYTDAELTIVYDFDEPVTEDITLYAKWITFNEEDPTDSDNDTLPDWLEVMYAADPKLEDTDGDGLSDYDELMLTNTDPAIVDTNKNGTSDADEDYDGDGLSNRTEVELGTNPLRKDTDGDSLSDADEPEYGTDRLLEDTDSDGASDGNEILLGTDPLSADEEFDVTVSSNTDDSVIPSVDITLSGDQIESLEIEPSVSSHLFPERMPGYLGMAYDFSVDGEFESATISFEFDVSILENGADPTIFYFNEEDQTLEELETTISGNIASAVVTHFSTYILIDRTVYYSSFSWEDVWDTEGTFHSVEIVLVIDDSGSMSSNDGSNQRLAVAQNLINKLPEGSKIGIVWFASSAKLLTSELTTDKESAKAYLTSDYFKSSGGTYMYTAINSGFTLFESTEDDVLKMMVVLSDGNSSGTSNHSSTIATAQENNIRIYTVGLGSSTSYFTSYLKPLAEETGGSFYLASEADELGDIYEDINKKIDLEADADSDDIPDYYEDNMIAFNGIKIELDKNDDDTDDDGLKDGEEVVVELVYNEDKTKVYVKGRLVSYPDKEDSEGDGIPDSEDTAPLTKGLKDGIIGNLYLITCYGESFSDGHSFFAYESYVNDEIDFSGLVNGWHRKDANQSWTYGNLERDTTPSSEYAITPGEYVCIGNGALGGGPSSGASDGLSDGSTAGDANGVNYNMETAKFLSAGKPTGSGVAFSYLSNTYITEEITAETLEKLISYLSKESVNYWSLKHNCAHVAAEGWNHISDTKVSAYGLAGWHIFATPAALRDNLRTISGHAEDWQMAEAFR